MRLLQKIAPCVLHHAEDPNPASLKKKIATKFDLLPLSDGSHRHVVKIVILISLVLLEENIGIHYIFNFEINLAY